jgi:hypothetical protein
MKLSPGVKILDRNNNILRWFLSDGKSRTDITQDVKHNNKRRVIQLYFTGFFLII